MFGFLSCSRSVLAPSFCVVLFLGLWAVAEFVVERAPTLKLSSFLQVCPGTLCRLHYFLRRYGRAGVIVRGAYSKCIPPSSCSAPQISNLSSSTMSDHSFFVKIMRPVADTPPWDIVFHSRVVVVRTGLFRPEASNIFLRRSRKIGRDGTWEYVNPKAITSDELYGIK